MKFIIAVDLEGTACTVGVPNKTLSEMKNYEFACRQAVKEANAAARALFDSGADEVYIWDNHGSSLNLEYDQIDERCSIILGNDAERRWPGLDETFSGVILIGYHPRDNTPDGVLAHTFSSVAYQWIKINDKEVGEIAIDAAVAGEIGVPVILVSSDDKGVVEAKEVMPWIETVETKKGLGRNLAISKHPVAVCDEIYIKTRTAVSRMDEMKPLLLGSPLKLQIRYKRLENAQAALRSKTGWDFVDSYTNEKKIDSIMDYF